ncbi:MAG: NAD(P)H-dependent oxidoreductase [Caulobacteraceae bacterium]|nr:NAD(P)H-dependent oxidoreductase [Caulobacteraceae bacterium]
MAVPLPRKRGRSSPFHHPAYGVAVPLPRTRGRSSPFHHPAYGVAVPLPRTRGRRLRPEPGRAGAIDVLVLFCHPEPGSFAGSIRAALEAELARAGHRVRILDLYAEGFDPVLDAEGWRAHRAGERHGSADIAPHVAALTEAEGLVLVYPTWWYGLPAVLKGWFDRVWQPGVAFTLEDGVFRAHRLPRLIRFAAIATYGSPRLFIEWLVGDPARRQLVRGLALQFAKGVRCCWAPIYAVDAKSEARLAKERARAVAKVARLFGA